MISLVAEQKHLRIEGGQPQAYDFAGGSGQKYDINFCGNCGTALWGNVHGKSKGLVYVRAGTLDESRKIQPQAHIYVKSKQDWVALPADVPSFDEMYSLQEVWPKESIARLYQK